MPAQKEPFERGHSKRTCPMHKSMREWRRQGMERRRSK